MKFCAAPLARRFGLYFVIAIAIFFANQSGNDRASDQSAVISTGSVSSQAR
jgi:hypothetical protein